MAATYGNLRSHLEILVLLKIWVAMGGSAIEEYHTLTRVVVANRKLQRHDPPAALSWPDANSAVQLYNALNAVYGKLSLWLSTTADTTVSTLITTSQLYNSDALRACATNTKRNDSALPAGHA